MTEKKRPMHCLEWRPRDALPTHTMARAMTHAGCGVCVRARKEMKHKLEKTNNGLTQEGGRAKKRKFGCERARTGAASDDAQHIHTLTYVKKNTPKVAKGNREAGEQREKVKSNEGGGWAGKKKGFCPPPPRKKI